MQRLEDAGKPVSKFMFIFFPERILSKHFFLFRRRLSSLYCSFIVHRKRSLPFTLWILTSHCAQPSHICNNWANREVRKKPAYQKRSHISLQLCWISEQALVHSFADGLQKWFRQSVGRLQCRLCLPSSAPFLTFHKPKRWINSKRLIFTRVCLLSGRIIINICCTWLIHLYWFSEKSLFFQFELQVL